MRTAEYVKKDSRFGKMFGNYMEDYNFLIMKKIMEVYNGFEGLTSSVGVGGGIGVVLHMITSKYPLIRGINFDLPHVIQPSSYPGIENIAGDMFVIILKGDDIFMKWILHNWDDESCLEILKNCHQALPEGDKVMVVDMVILEGGLDKSLFQFRWEGKDVSRASNFEGSHRMFRCSSCSFCLEHRCSRDLSLSPPLDNAVVAQVFISLLNLNQEEKSSPYASWKSIDIQLRIIRCTF